MSMTNEQREAIELAKEFTRIDFSNPLGWTGYYDTELKELQQAIQTALSLIKEQEKQIDLMALAILNYDDQLIINRYKNIDDVKQCFADLAKGQ